MKKPGYLVIEDGTIFRCTLFGHPHKTFGELIFNTSMTGYQEIIYDPSYEGQIVVMTYPLIGNYGVNAEDKESYRIHLEGFVIHQLSRISSNWRSEQTLEQLFEDNGIVGVENLDTRRITLLLREKGALRAGIFPEGSSNRQMLEEVLKSPSLVGKDIVKNVVRAEPYWWNREGKYTIVVIDCGTKYNILRLLAERNSRVYVVPAGYPSEEIIKENPDGILLSNGPGDPEPLDYIVRTVQNLVERYPVFGICLGHQILGMTFGGKTYKLKFGHHGANHPSKDLITGKIHITVQNHGFCVDIESLKDPQVEITHINLNDQTFEGMHHRKYPVFSVQFHPEASPGPNDAVYLFDYFFQLIENAKKN